MNYYAFEHIYAISFFPFLSPRSFSIYRRFLWNCMRTSASGIVPILWGITSTKVNTSYSVYFFSCDSRIRETESYTPVSRVDRIRTGAVSWKTECYSLEILTRIQYNLKGSTLPMKFSTLGLSQFLPPHPPTPDKTLHYDLAHEDSR